MVALPLLLILEIFNLNCFSYMHIRRGHACQNMPGAYSVYKFCDGYIQGQAIAAANIMTACT